MRNPPADPAYVRAQIHLLASYLTDFIEVALAFDPDPEEIADRKAHGDRSADHPNFAARTHNFDVSFALEPLIPFRWFDGEGEPPPCFTALAGLLEEVLRRWGWPLDVREAKDYPPGELVPITYIGEDDPPVTLTRAEVARFHREMRGLEWYIYTLPRDEDLASDTSYAVDLIGPEGEVIDRLLTPVFFTTRRFLSTADLPFIRQTTEDLKADPAVYEVHLTHIFRQTFGIGQPGRNPDGARLLDILDRAKAFVAAVETCLPVEVDGRIGPRTFGTDWMTGEFYVCESASALCDVLDGPEGQHSDSSASSARGWNAEVNYGLRSLDSQLEQLLARWDVTTWEHRMAQAEKEPESPVTIRPEELDGLRITVETIERGVNRLGLSAPRPVEKAPGEDVRPREARKKQRKIIQVYHDHPDWSLSQIAAASGADRGYVCRTLKPLRDRMRAEWMDRLPRGSKDRDGDVEAWPA